MLDLILPHHVVVTEVDGAAVVEIQRLRLTLRRGGGVARLPIELVGADKPRYPVDGCGQPSGSRIPPPDTA